MKFEEVYSGEIAIRNYIPITLNDK